MSDPRARITLLMLDVDGVLTDGTIVLDANGCEIKRFHARDGLGIKLWTGLGYQIAIVSGRTSAAVEARMAELGVTA
ncbi:MAG: phenylphosphate carboxylase subunit delta, partial [Planctomycetes bacterium]|nr:phenylphosphate carboxylase subunit delta [Planctomycetota bacterium]